MDIAKESVLNGTGDMVSFISSFIILSLIIIVMIFSNIRIRYVLLTTVITIIILPIGIIKILNIYYDNIKEEEIVEYELYEMDYEGSNIYYKKKEEAEITLEVKTEDGIKEISTEPNKLSIESGQENKIKIAKYTVKNKYLSNLIEEDKTYIKYKLYLKE